MASLPPEKPFKSPADVRMDRESPAASFGKRRAAQRVAQGLAPTIATAALEKSDRIAWALTYGPAAAVVWLFYWRSLSRAYRDEMDG